MSIEKQTNINFENVDKIVNIIDRFYEIDHFSESGTSFKFGNKPNMDRVRFLLENIATGNLDNFSFSDKKDFFDIFSFDMIRYFHEFIEIDNLFNDNADFNIFLQNFLKEIFYVKKEIEKSNLLMEIKKFLKNALDIKDNFKIEIEKGGKIKILKMLGSKDIPVFLVRSEHGEIYFVDAKKNEILFECGDTFEKGYSFAGNKIFVFEKPQIFDFEEIKKEMQIFDMQNADAKIEDFLNYIKMKYNIKNNIDIKQIQNGENFIKMEISILLQSDDILGSLFSIMNKTNFLMRKKQIFVENDLGGILNLGMWDKILEPSKIAEGYKDKNAIKMPIEDCGKTKILVTNGYIYDVFDME